MILSFVPTVFAVNLNCTYLSDISTCNGAIGTKILGINRIENSHVEAPNQSMYQAGVCCKDDGVSSKNILNFSGTNFANISSITNAHFGFSSYVNGYQLKMGIPTGVVECQVFSDTSTCQSQNYSSCVVELYNNAGNTHILECNETSPKNPHLCCRLKYADTDVCSEDLDCLGACDDDGVSNGPDEGTCFDPSACVNGVPILGGGTGKCEYDNSCGADVTCDETVPGDISAIDSSACCINTCQVDFSLGSVDFGSCDYKNDTARIKWCLSDATSTCSYTGGGDACDPILGWVATVGYCPIPGTVTNGSCYYNPTLPRFDDCNGMGCAVLSMSINSGEYCDPQIGVTDILREIEFDKTVVKNGDIISVSYYGKVGINVIINATNVGAGYVNLSYDGQKYVGYINVNDNSNGVKFLYVSATDMFSKSVTFNTSIYLDDILPNASVVINDNISFTNSRFVTLTLNASDDYVLGNCSYSLDITKFEQWSSCYNYFSLDLGVSSGNIFVYVNVSDLAGNSLVVYDNITVDEASVNSLIYDNSTFISQSHNFIFTNGLNNYYSLDGSSFVSVSDANITIDTSILADGAHSLQIKNTWLFGRVSYSDLKLFISDNTLPDIRIILPSLIDSNGLITSFTANNTISFDVFDSNLNISTINVTFDNFVSSFDSYAHCISNGRGYVCSYVESGLNTNTRFMNIAAKDLAGNNRLQIYAINYSDDVTGPVITVVYPQSKMNGQTVPLEVTTNEPSICRASFYTQTYRYMEFAMYAFTPLNYKTNVPVITNHNYTAYFACSDLSGKVSVTSKDFFVDLEVTKINVISPTQYSNSRFTELKVQTDENATCKFDYSDKLYSLMQYDLLNVQNNVTNYNHTLQVDLANGTIFYIRCVDIWNNSNAASTLIATILDDGRPIITFDTSSHIAQKQIKFSVYETVSEIDNISIKINDTDSSLFDITTCTNNGRGLNCSYTESLLTFGNNKVTIIVTDNANNVNIEDFLINYDDIIPSLLMNTLSGITNNPNLLLNITTNANICRWSYVNSAFNNMEYLFTGSIEGSMKDVFYPVLLTQGLTNFYVKCQDYAGNENSTSLSVTLDTFVEKPRIFLPVPVSVISGVTTINFTSDLSSVTLISMNGGTFVSTTASTYHLLNTSKYSDGEIIVRLKSIDSTNNVVYGDIVRYRIDNTPSSIYILSPIDGSYVYGNILIKVRATDDTYSINYTISNASGGVGSVLYSAVLSNQTISFDTNSIPDGYYNISVTSKNVVNQIIDTNKVTIYVDNLISVAIVSDDTLYDVDNVSVVAQQNLQNVVLEIDNQTIGELSNSPVLNLYNFQFDTSLFSNANHTLSATVYSFTGMSNTTTKQIIIDNRRTMSITAPLNAENIKGDYNVTFIGEVLVNPKLVVDGFVIDTLFDSVSGYVLINTTRYVDGLHEMYLIDGIYSSSKIVFNIKNFHATTILEPKNFKNPGAVFMKVFAPDYAKRVDFLVDFVSVYSDTISPFEYTYNVGTAGVHNFTAISYDASNVMISNDTKLFEIDNFANFTLYIPSNISGSFVFEPSSSEYLDYIYEISTNGTEWYSVEKYIDTSAMENGNYIIRVTGIDVVGNKYIISNNTLISNAVLGSVTVLKPYVKDKDIQVFTIQLGSTSYNVSVVSPFVAKFNDAGIDGDESAGDAKFTYNFNVSDNETHQVTYTINLMKFTGNSVDVNVSFYVDNVAPEGSIIINNNEEFVLLLSNYTNISVVEVKTTYFDNIAVDSCRVYYKTPIPFEPCSSSKIVMFDDGYGYKQIIYEIKDVVGNVYKLDTHVVIVPFDKQTLLNDTTNPIYISNITSGLYFNNNKTLSFEYTAGYDLEDYLLQYPLSYAIAIGSEPYNASDSNSNYNDSLTFDQIESGDTTSLSKTIILNSSSELSDGLYYVSVRTKNHAGLYNVTSSIFYVDVTPPTLPEISSNIIEGEWNSNSSVVFSYIANDSISGVASYKYLIDRFNDSLPVLYTTLNALTFDMPDGIWYFHLLGIDGAGNIGAVKDFMFKVDESAPSKIFVNTRQTSSDLYINWTPSNDFESGIKNYNLIVSISNGTMIDINLTDVSYVIYNITNETYDISVRGRNNANILSDDSLQTFEMDLIAPSILVKKPTGTVASNVVYPYVETDEFAICFIKVDGSLDNYTTFVSTNARQHIHKLTLNSNGPYVYDIRCMDSYGNINDTTLSFISDDSARVVGVSFDNVANSSYVTQLLEFTINISGESSELIDDVERNSFTVDVNKNSQDFSFQNLGQGIYKIQIVTPNDVGNKPLRVCVLELCTTSYINILPITITTTFTSQNVEEAYKKSNLAYSNTVNYTIGVASDSESYDTNYTSNTISINYDASVGFGYLFLTKQNASISSSERLLQYNKFDSQNSPSFGYASSNLLDVSARLRYPYIFNFSKSIRQYVNETPYYLSTRKASDIILSSGGEETIKQYRLAITYVGNVNGTPLFNFDVVN